MDDDQQFCLRWNNHQSTLISVFDTLLENGTLVDCTLAAEGKVLKAHKVVLSACSPYFATLLAQQYDKHPIFILKDVKFQELRAMMDYMYRGEVNISQDQLAALLKAAESLQIKGLSDNRAASSVPQPPPPQQQQPPAKKQGLTIEHKRAQAQAAAAAAAKLAAESDVSMSREGSSSPSGRKRKKVRRRTVEQATAAASDASGADVAATNAAATTSSNAQSTALASNAAAAAVSAATAAAAAAAANNAAATASSSALASSSANASAVSVTKKTDISDAKKELDQSQRAAAANDHDDDDDDDDEDDDDQHDMEPRTQRMKHQHQQQDGAAGNDELLIEPKSEYDNDETVEDLTMDDEELLEDLEQAGPSHGGEGSSHGYAQWQVDRQDEVFMGGQESAGQHRDAQAFVDLKHSTVSLTGVYSGSAALHVLNPFSDALRCAVKIEPMSIDAADTADTIDDDDDDDQKPIINNNDDSMDDKSELLEMLPIGRSAKLEQTPPVSDTSSAASTASTRVAAAPPAFVVLDKSVVPGLTCKYCARTFRKRGFLVRHQHKKCTAAPHYRALIRCAQCPYTSKVSWRVAAHMKREHENDFKKPKATPTPPPEPAATNDRRSSCSNHRSCDPPIQCSYCSYTTKQPWRMPRHMLLAHPKRRVENADFAQPANESMKTKASSKKIKKEKKPFKM